MYHIKLFMKQVNLVAALLLFSLSAFAQTVTPDPGPYQPMNQKYEYRWIKTSGGIWNIGKFVQVDSAQFSGVTYVPTAPDNDSSLRVASTAWVKKNITAGGGSGGIDSVRRKGVTDTIQEYYGGAFGYRRFAFKAIETEGVTVSSYGKNATADSTILLLSNGTRYAAKDSVGGSSSGGSSISYYLNGGTAASVGTYFQMSTNAVVGANADFTRTGNGLISQFLTDVGDPNRLQIPAGNWNFEMFFSMSSSGGTPQFYVELLKYDGTTFTSIASSSAIPETISSGTAIDLYLTSLAIPTTTLLATDRLALRVYIVNNSGGRTATLHTQDSHLCQIITNFAGGISALNGLTANTQYFATGTSGTDFNIASATDTHTLNLPTASATNTGKLSSTDWSTFNSKLSVTSYGKNAGGDSTILLLSNGTRYAAKDSVGAGGSNIYTADGSLSSARTLTLNSQPLTIAGTTSSRFFANGNVGIGTTTDGGYKLNVLGTARVQGTDFVLTGSTGSSNSVRTSVTNTDAQGAADFFYFNSTGNFFGGQMYGTGYAGTTANVTNNNLAKFITNASNFVIGTQAVSPIIFSVNTSAFAGEVARFSTGNNLLVGTTTDVASSKLTITSTTQGVLFPRMTTTQRNAISSPAEGLNVYNTTLSTNDVKTSAAWYQQPNGLSGSGTLDFASTSAFNSSDLTVTITGAAVGDIVMLGTPVQDANSTFTAFVSATNTVTIRMNNYSALAINPASGTFKVYVIKN
jgi:hypothetical protein